MTTLVDDDFCFACGEKNRAGLQMRFEPDEETGTVRARAYLDARFQGWQGVAHGGIVATLIDDAMAYAGVEAFGGPGVIGQLNVRFRKPVPVGAIAVVRARVTRRRRNVLKLEAQVLNEGGLLLVTALGTFVGKERMHDE
jgi:acyl-coenzyme A thioesterase PaaI-like protein